MNRARATVCLWLCTALSAAGCSDAQGPSAPVSEGQVVAQQSALRRRPPRPPHGPDATPFATRDPRVLALRERQVRRIYENLVFPTPIAILTGAQSVDDIFEREVVKGRVTPVGSFLDFNAVVEYFYALAVTPGSQVQNVTFRSLFAGDDKVAVAVDIFFCRAPDQQCDPSVPVSATSQTLTQVGFFQFNKENRVVSMDLNILNLGAASDPPNDPAAHAAAIANVCTALTRIHVEPTTGAVVNGGTCTSYFDSADDFSSGFVLSADPYENCVNFMQSIPYGTWDRANSNSVTCRQLHTLLTAIDPEMHCPHASPSGGGKCIDHTYASYYDEDF